MFSLATFIKSSEGNRVDWRLSQRTFCVKNVRFGASVRGEKAVLDVGASTQEGSLKMAYYDRDWEQLASQKTTVSPGGIISGEDFVQKIAQAIKALSDQAHSQIAKIKEIVIFLPGICRDTQAVLLPNLRNKQGQSLKNVDFRPINEQLGIDAKILVANDIMGATAAIIKAVSEHPTYKTLLHQDGFTGVVCMVGGGFGVSSFERIGDQIQLDDSQSGHLHSVQKAGSMESSGASVPGLLRNYAQKLNVSPQAQEALVKAGKALLVTNPDIEVPFASPEYQNLMKSGLYREEPSDPENSTIRKLSLRPEYRKIHEAAMVYAIDQFLDTLAQLIHTKIPEKRMLYLSPGLSAKG